MKPLASVAIIAGALAACAAPKPPQPPQPATALLEGLVGQTCSGQADNNDLRYTVRDRAGNWAVHDVFGPHGAPASAMTDAGWRPATVDGSTLTFPGVTVANVVLTATGPHSASLMAGSRMRMYGPFTITCSPDVAK